MHIAIIMLSVLLALELAATGAMKVIGTGTARANAEHLGVSPGLSRFIGGAELAAAAGLLAGLAIKPLAMVTAAAVVALMVGAIGYHLKARDKISAVLPAVITAGAAMAVLALALAA